MIKIKNLVTNKSKYKIFVDMDGTIADFDSAFINIADIIEQITIARTHLR